MKPNISAALTRPACLWAAVRAPDELELNRGENGSVAIVLQNWSSNASAGNIRKERKLGRVEDTEVFPEVF